MPGSRSRPPSGWARRPPAPPPAACARTSRARRSASPPSDRATVEHNDFRMAVIPLLLDWRPEYLDRGHDPESLLLVSIGSGTVLDLVARRVRSVTAER